MYKIVLFGTLSFLVRLSHFFFICHYVTGCYISRGKHLRAGITVLMMASSSYIEVAYKIPCSRSNQPIDRVMTLYIILENKWI